MANILIILFSYLTCDQKIKGQIMVLKNSYRVSASGFTNSEVDEWRCCCYVFSAELKDKCFLNCSKHNTYTIDNLEIDTKALKELGGQYIISGVYINNYEKLNLTFEKLFEDESAYWNIYLYKVN